MQYGTHKDYPCRGCKRVRDPVNCENKACKDWKAWFISRWEAMRASIREQAHGKGVPGTPISVGGVKYHHPERVREFLAMDPCVRCPWRDGLCEGTCDARQIWLKDKEESIELEK